MPPATKTDDEIFASIPGMEDFISEHANTEDTTTATADQTEVTGTTAAGNDGSTSGQQDTQQQTTGEEGTGQSSNAGNAQEQVITRKDGLVERPNKDNPRARDLVDPITGRVMAHGGIERHIFETAQRHRRENETLKQRIQTLESQVGGTSEVSRAAAQLQLQPQEQVAALQAMADFKRDPVRVLEQLVAEVKAKGYEIPFLEQGINAGIDTRAINAMLDQKLAPITQQQRIAEEQAQAHAQAERELTTFLDNIPEARENLEVIGQMITANPALTLDRAYLDLVRWCNLNGLDHTTSIKAQLEARAGQQTQQATPAPQAPQQNAPRNTSTAPLPMNGRGAAQTAVREAESTVDENSSWRNIVRQAMSESGMSV